MARYPAKPKRWYKQSGTRKSIHADRVRSAKKSGYRTVTGTKRPYFENRRNRSDAKGSLL